MAKNSEKAVKKTTNKIVRSADDSGTRSLENKRYEAQNPMDIEYVNETHVADFMKALDYDPIDGYDSSNAEHISAWTDALPVRSTNATTIPITKKQRKTSKRKLLEQEAAKPKGISHSLMQYPLIVSVVWK
jgi:hypothetical protein